MEPWSIMDAQPTYGKPADLFGGGGSAQTFPLKTPDMPGEKGWWDRLVQEDPHTGMSPLMQFGIMLTAMGDPRRAQVLLNLQNAMKPPSTEEIEDRELQRKARRTQLESAELQVQGARETLSDKRKTRQREEEARGAIQGILKEKGLDPALADVISAPMLNKMIAGDEEELSVSEMRQEAMKMVAQSQKLAAEVLPGVTPPKVLTPEEALYTLMETQEKAKKMKKEGLPPQPPTGGASGGNPVYTWDERMGSF